MAVKKELLILGFGEMGHAMKKLLQPFHNVKIWNRTPIKSVTVSSLGESVKQAEIILFMLPVNAHNEILQTISPFLKEKTLCIGIAKGLNEQGQTVCEIFTQNNINYALIYGPMISEELCNNKMGFAEFSCNKESSVSIISKLFAPTQLYLQKSQDLRGISWSVILKNVYALAFGMVDYLQLGKNMQGFITVMALQELNDIIKSLGGKEKSCYGLAGLGDLITTGNSHDSHHHKLGYKMAQGDFSNIKGEGIHTLLMIKKFAHFKWEEYPLFVLIDKVISQKTTAEEGLSNLCKTALKK